MTADQNDAGGKVDEMKKIPVLFNGASVRAILDDRKTQTRRPLKPHLQQIETWRTDGHGRFYGVSRLATTGGLGVPETDFIENPLGKPGDRLWVRETWMPYDTSTEEDAVWVLYKASNDQRPDGIAPEKFGSGVRRSAPVQVVEWARDAIEMEEAAGGRWRPSIHMPRWAARLFLDVVDVRIERLQDISEEDAQAEGVEQCGGFMTTWGCWMNYGKSGPSCKTARESFQTLWISVYGAESWAANPWVWVTKFKRFT